MPDFSEMIDDRQFEEINNNLFKVAKRLKGRLEIDDVIDELADKYEVALSPAALMLLSAPLFEASFAQRFRQQIGVYDEALDVEAPDIRATLEVLIREAVDEPARGDLVPEEIFGVDERGKRRRMRSSLSIIKAMFRRFCNIPPFCGEVK